MTNASAKYQAEYRKRKKLMAKGYIRLDLWVLPETIKLVRHGLRNQKNLIKPRKEVEKNANEVLDVFRSQENE